MPDRIVAMAKTLRLPKRLASQGTGIEPMMAPMEGMVMNMAIFVKSPVQWMT